MWRYGSLTVEPFETLRAAVVSAQTTQDFGDGSLERIEGASDDEIATVVAQIRAEEAETEEAERQADQARLADGPRLVVWLKAPERPRGRHRPWCGVGIFYGRDAAQQVAEQWQGILGADRVRIAARRPT
jgi:hypothetical protein